MARLIQEQGAPKYISSDNGLEFFGDDLREWARCQRESSPGISTLEAHAQRLYQQLLCKAQTGVSQWRAVVDLDCNQDAYRRVELEV